MAAMFLRQTPPLAWIAALALLGLSARAADPTSPVLVLENDLVRYEIGGDGRNLRFLDKSTGVDRLDAASRSFAASVRAGGREHAPSAASREGERLRLELGTAGVTVTLRAVAEERHLTIEVLSLEGPGVEGKGVEALTFVNVPLALEGKPGEPFAACALALNLKTHVEEIPQPSRRLVARCYPRFGFAGARAALIACPPGELRDALKEVVTAAPDLPHSPIGGPWALDAQIGRGSYLFNFGGLSEKTADEWIDLARRTGMNQIDFHGGQSFRFGDCRPNPETYPDGLKSLRAAVDRLHASGIAAGLHTYAFFIDKRCPWVTPVPDPRLAKDATFALAGPIAADAKAAVVLEPTGAMSAVTGFFVRNSATVQVDDELITYGGVSKEPPYTFTGLVRGALGTRAAPHAAGRPVHHLKECFGLFAPDGDSTLLEEVAARTAQAFNEGGFDMMYMDALDGEDVLGGPENGWHYGSKFVFEVWKRLERPAAMEMSTFHHHLWCVRSRMGAWDHPTRGHKRFIDIHCEANEAVRRMFLPGHLGWWAVKRWSGIQGEPTYSDDIEYLCAKALGNDVGISVMGIDPVGLKTVPVLERLAGILRQHEELRRGVYFDEAVKAKLREPGKEFTLFRDPSRRWRFRRAGHAKHKVEAIDGASNAWTAENPFGEQPLGLRIEALLSAGPYDAPGSVTLADFASPGEFGERSAAPGVAVELRSAPEPARPGLPSGAFRATNSGKIPRKAAWAKARKTFAPTLDLSKHQALGLWVHGDGRGEVLNLQLTCPSHLVAGIGEHYVAIDFTGWRYVELIEPEAERYSEYSWPYGSPYAIYRENVDYGHVESLGLWYNNLPEGGEARCSLSPIRALPLVPAKLKSPAVTAGGKTIVFPVEMEPGSYLELLPGSGCKLYGPDGTLLGEVAPRGEAPVLRPGANGITFGCDGEPGIRPRARVTVILEGDAL